VASRQEHSDAGHGAPFLVYRDAAGAEAVADLAATGGRFTIGRRAGNALTLDWDAKVSRVHAALERVGDEWVLTDDGLSQNGTFLNGRRLLSRKRLVDGDHIGVGGTDIVFHDPATEAASTETELDLELRLAEVLTPGQREVLVALCRPFAASEIAGPATNQQIAEELGVTLDTVKSALRGLFALFGLEDLPQNQKRASLALEALRSGIVTQAELRSPPAPAARRSSRGR
jgi:hypothetical protein